MVCFLTFYSQTTEAYEAQLLFQFQIPDNGYSPTLSTHLEALSQQTAKSMGTNQLPPNEHRTFILRRYPRTKIIVQVVKTFYSIWLIQV